MKIIHISDPHVVRAGETLYGLDPRERFAACIEDINKNHPDADLCVVTGDLVHMGDEASYAVLRDIVERLSVPYRLLLGNHDNRGSFRRVFPEVPVDGAGFVQSVEDAKGYRLIFLDTLEPGTHAGGYCEKRQAWLSARLAEAGHTPVCLFMHHPPFDIGIPSLDMIGLMQQHRFASILETHKARIRHLFLGHVHRPVMGSWRGIPFTAIRGTSHQCWLDFAATDQPAGSHEPPSYGIILLNGENTVVHMHDYMDASPKFAFEPRPERRAQAAGGSVAAE